MQSTRLTRVGRLALVLLAVFAFGAITAAAAQAEEAPFWSIQGTRLAAGKTHYITAKVYNVTGAEKGVSLTALTGQKVHCESVRLGEGVLLGSNAGNPGTNDEVIEFFGSCTVANNGAACKVTEPIITNPVKSELVESEKSTTAALLVEFFTESGPFVTLKFTGTCNLASTAVSGKVAGEVREDPGGATEGSLGAVVKLPNGKIQAKSWLLNFPNPSIKHVWLIKNEIGEETKIELTSFSETSTLTGTALLLLANAKKESEETLWSPLP